MSLLNPLSAADLTALNTVSQALGIPSNWLADLITFESGWDPKAVNPSSNAAGLIQFMPDTARGLGYQDSFDLVRRNLDRPSQLLGPVYRYLFPMTPFPTPQSLYMAVFYPKARTWSLDTQFPLDVQTANPGIKTVQDYMNKVTYAKITSATKPVLILGLVLLSLYFITHLQKDGFLWQTNERTEQVT